MRRQHWFSDHVKIRLHRIIESALSSRRCRGFKLQVLNCYGLKTGLRYVSLGRRNSSHMLVKSFNAKIAISLIETGLRA
jgi:hypothetical protein